MAAYPCKFVAQLAFKAGGDIFHHFVAKNPQHLAKASPEKVKACNLHQGAFNTNGSVIQWNYTIDGKELTAKQTLQDIDNEKKTISFKMIEGDLMELYKSMLITIHVETKDGVDFATWTIEYELLKPDNPHPISTLNMFIEITNDIEAHILGSA